MTTKPSPRKNQPARSAAAGKLRAAGADAILIVRLADSVHRSSPVPIGGGNTLVERSSGQIGGFDYYTVSRPGPGGMQRSLRLHVYIETSLYELKSEKKLWSGFTETVVNEDTDRMAEVGPLVDKVLTALRADGLIR